MRRIVLNLASAVALATGATGEDYLDMASCTVVELEQAEAEYAAGGASCAGQGHGPAYFIEFAQNVENILRLQCQLRRVFCPVIMVHAVNRTDYHFTEKQLQKLKDTNSSTAQGIKERNIMASHKAIWRKIAHYGSEGEWTGVFEADAILREDFHERVAEFGRLVAARKAGIDKSDMLFIGHCHEFCPRHADRFGLDLGGGVAVVESTRPWCTHGYMLSYKGALRLLEQDFPTDWPIDNLMEETLVRKESFAENIHHLLMYYLAHDFDCRTLCPPILRQKRWEWPVGELRDNLKRNGFIHIQDDNAFWKGHHRLTKWTMELLAIPLVPVAIYITSRVYRRRLLRFGRWLVRRLWFSPLGGVDK
mmetsp:Transcript_124190/g.277086  ORF Transcript_124190/g.277086 Transcript_124190/m.277086 type:complete len:363 (-) Transcript_124190:71-1159(-)